MSQSIIGYELKDTIINNRYSMIDTLGYGAYSSIWLIFDYNKNDFYVMKVHSQQDYEVAQREIDTMEQLFSNNMSCENFPVMYDNFDYKKYKMVVFKLYGGSLEEIIQTNSYINGLPVLSVIKIIQQLISAIDVLHSQLNIIHGDIRPDNILIKNISNEMSGYILKSKLAIREIIATSNDLINGIHKIDVLFKKTMIRDFDNLQNKDKSFTSQIINDANIVLADFGCSVDLHSPIDSIKQHDEFLAPELVLEIAANTGIDIWSIGCTMYNLLTGESFVDLEDYEQNGNYSYTEYILYKIIEKVGYPSNKMIEESEFCDEYFVKIKNEYKLKMEKNIPMKKLKLENIISANIKETISDDLMKNIIDFMKILLNINYKKRDNLNYSNLLKHPVFNSI